MKIILSSLLLTFYFHCQAQNFFFQYRPDTTNSFCLEQFDKAEEDFKNWDFELQIMKGTRFSKSLLLMLKDDYNVNAAFPEIFIENCYNYHLKELLNKKFGEDVLKVSELKADEYDQGNHGTRMEKYIGYGKILTEFLFHEMTRKEIKNIQKKYAGKTLHMKVEINEVGKCKILNIDDGTRNIYERIFGEIIDGEILFNPRVIEGEGQTTWHVYPITVDEIKSL
jgi:hypothetical protein